MKGMRDRYKGEEGRVIVLSTFIISLLRRSLLFISAIGT